MAVTIHSDDVLPHIDANAPAPVASAPAAASTGTLEATSTAVSGSITLFGLILVSWTISSDDIAVTAVLKTPFGDVSLGSVTLNAQNPTVTIGGGGFGFKAEVTLTLNVAARTLTIAGTACAPFVGCKSGSTVIHI